MIVPNEFCSLCSQSGRISALLSLQIVSLSSIIHDEVHVYTVHHENQHDLKNSLLIHVNGQRIHYSSTTTSFKKGIEKKQLSTITAQLKKTLKIRNKSWLLKKILNPLTPAVLAPANVSVIKMHKLEPFDTHFRNGHSLEASSKRN